MVVVENRVGVLGEEEMEEAARKDFQEEPGMMERWPFYHWGFASSQKITF